MRPHLNAGKMFNHSCPHRSAFFFLQQSFISPLFLFVIAKTHYRRLHKDLPDIDRTWRPKSKQQGPQSVYYFHSSRKKYKPITHLKREQWRMEKGKDEWMEWNICLRVSGPLETPPHDLRCLSDTCRFFFFFFFKTYPKMNRLHVTLQPQTRLRTLTSFDKTCGFTAVSFALHTYPCRITVTAGIWNGQHARGGNASSWNVEQQRLGPHEQLAGGFG